MNGIKLLQDSAIKYTGKILLQTSVNDPVKSWPMMQIFLAYYIISYS